MFIGTIETLESSHVEYPAAIRQALEYLRAHDFTQMADGAYEVAPGIRANVQRYQTKPVAECRPEAHEKYVIGDKPLTIACYNRIIGIFSAYKKLGGNGAAEKMMDEIKHENIEGGH